MLKKLLRFEFESQQELNNKRAQDNKEIKQACLENESTRNYVFRVPEMDYYVKIAGPVNRAQSALIERGVWLGQEENEEINKMFYGKG